MKEKIAVKTHHDSRKLVRICTNTRLPLAKRSVFGTVSRRNSRIMNDPKIPDSDLFNESTRRVDSSDG